ncbi:MAG: GDSL-type esterase/lipase family protein, partial [Rikenellaceae bacterium]
YDQCNCILRDLRSGKFKSAVLGNSIVQNWIGDAPHKIRNGGGKVGRLGKDSWERYMDGFINMGIGADRVENLLWRVYNDQFEIVQFDRIIIMIGTNNIKLKNTYDEIAAGIDNLISQIQIRQPQAQIVVVGVLPRKDMSWADVQSLNAKVEPYAIKRGVKYVNVGAALLDENDIPRSEFYGDNVHLSAQGYMAYSEALMRELK